MQEPRILLVEDDAELRALVEGRLKESGYNVRTAETGTQALERVEEQVPDLVLLDVMLPELDGLEVCRRLRANTPYSTLLCLRHVPMNSIG